MAYAGNMEGGNSLADHLSARVYRRGGTVDPVQVGDVEGTEIVLAASLRPQENMPLLFSEKGGLKRADDLSAVIHRINFSGPHARIAEIDHPACLGPRERMSCGQTISGDADDLPAGVQSCSLTLGETQRTEIDHYDL